MRVLLLGGTDLTLAAGERLRSIGVGVAGVVYVPKQFAISYRPTPLQSSRFADLQSWCANAAIPAREYTGVDSIIDHAREVNADFALAAGWYHMIPRHVRQVFARGCAGLHGSLLPKLRGGAPLAWAILSGESQTGMTLFELGDGIDDGAIYGQRSFPIGPRARVGELVRAAEAAALDLIADCLPRIADASLTPTPQSGVASYGLQRGPTDGRINWQLPAEEIDRLIRAVGRPYPGATTTFDGQDCLIWDAEPLAAPVILGSPGQIARIPERAEPCVVTGRGALVIRDVTDRDGASLLPLLQRSANQRLL